MGTIFNFIIGSVIGSFFGLIIDRLPTGRTIIFGRSCCSGCQRKLTSRELIPILSALLLGFRCYSCQVRIPFWYTGLELYCGLLFTLSCLDILGLPQILMLLMSVILSIFDWQYHEFPLIIWLFFTSLIFFISPFRPLTLVWLFLSALTAISNLKIGSGDFLWIYSAALTITFLQVIWTIQIASALGIFSYFLLKKKGEIAFVPYLTVAYIILLLLQAQ